MNAATIADALRPYCETTVRGRQVRLRTDGGTVYLESQDVTPAHLAILTRGPVRDDGGWSCPLSDFLTATNEVSR